MEVSVLYCGMVISWLLLVSVSISRQESGQLIERLTVEGREQYNIEESMAGNRSFQATHEEVDCSESNKWLVKDEKTGKCHCGGDSYGQIQCNAYTNEVLVLDCYCMTQLSEEDDVYVVGSCVFNCRNMTDEYYDALYHGTPSDCSQMNRQGTLCGQCRDGYALPAYAYTFTCIECDDAHQNWGLYVAHAFLPLSLFIVIILVLRVNVVDPKLHVFILAAQNLATPILLRILLPYGRPGTPPSHKQYPLLFIATVYGIWNLDFFRVNVLPDVCINILPLHTLALDYLVAIYPMLLMGIAYIVVELHGAGFRPVLYMWRPFHRLFVRFRRHWGIQTSIMDAFITFFVLSTTKMFSVTYDFLVGITIITADGKSTFHMFNQPDIKWFHKGHLPYALLAISMSVFFIIFPLFVLLFYQSKIFRKCLTLCQLRGATLDEFVNTFQQYYKDGSDGTHDCRWFSGFFIIIKIAAFAVYAITLEEIANVLLSILCIIAAIITLILNPFKKEYEVFNRVYAVFCLWTALFFGSMSVVGLSGIIAVRFFTGYYVIGLLGFTPLIYMTLITVHHIGKRCKLLRKKDFVGSVATPTSLPDRLLNSEEYRDSFGYVAASSTAQKTESYETETYQ